MTPKTQTPPSEWDMLPAALEMPNTLAATAAKIDVIAIIPEPIRMRAEASLTVNAERVAAKSASVAGRPRVDYHWDCQPVATEDQGRRFAELLVKYAKYRPSDGDIPYANVNSPKGQVTARPQAPGFYVVTSNGKPIAATKDATGAFLGVRYSVRPFEQRKEASRLPGTT